jgi:hypothetical protein
MSSGQGRLLENPSSYIITYSRYERGQRTSSDGRRHCPRMPGLDASDSTPALNPVYHTGMSGPEQDDIMSWSLGRTADERRKTLLRRLLHAVDGGLLSCFSGGGA